MANILPQPNFGGGTETLRWTGSSSTFRYVDPNKLEFNKGTTKSPPMDGYGIDPGDTLTLTGHANRAVDISIWLDGVQLVTVEDAAGNFELVATVPAGYVGGDGNGPTVRFYYAAFSFTSTLRELSLELTKNVSSTVTVDDLTATGTEGESLELSLVGSTDFDPDTLTWTAEPLPAGLTLDGDTITGTPTAEGTVTTTLTAVDQNGSSDTGTIVWTIAAYDPGPEPTYPDNLIGQPKFGETEWPLRWTKAEPVTPGFSGLPTHVKVTDYTETGWTLEFTYGAMLSPETSGVGLKPGDTITVTLFNSGAIQTTIRLRLGDQEIGAEHTSTGEMEISGTVPAGYVGTEDNGPRILSEYNSGTAYSYVSLSDVIGTKTASDPDPDPEPTNSVVIVENITTTGTEGESLELSLVGSTDFDPDTLTWTAEPLPAGLTLDGDTITGTPTAEGTVTTTLTAVDQNGSSDTGTIVWTIDPAPNDGDDDGEGEEIPWTPLEPSNPIEPDPGDGDDNPLSPEWTDLAEKTAAFLGRPEDEALKAQAYIHTEIVAGYVAGYTRGRGFDSDGAPKQQLRYVIVSAAARLASNPEQVSYFQAADYTERPAVLAGWTLPELAILHNFRRRSA